MTTNQMYFELYNAMNNLTDKIVLFQKSLDQVDYIPDLENAWNDILQMQLKLEKCQQIVRDMTHYASKRMFESYKSK